jgi:hypothetical protein
MVIFLDFWAIIQRAHRENSPNLFVTRGSVKGSRPSEADQSSRTFDEHFQRRKMCSDPDATMFFLAWIPVNGIRLRHLLPFFVIPNAVRNLLPPIIQQDFSLRRSSK